MLNVGILQLNHGSNTAHQFMLTEHDASGAKLAPPPRPLPRKVLRRLVVDAGYMQAEVAPAVGFPQPLAAITDAIAEPEPDGTDSEQEENGGPELYLKSRVGTSRRSHHCLLMEPWHWRPQACALPTSSGYHIIVLQEATDRMRDWRQERWHTCNSQDQFPSASIRRRPGRLVARLPC